MKSINIKSIISALICLILYISVAAAQDTVKIVPAPEDTVFALAPFDSFQNTASADTMIEYSQDSLEYSADLKTLYLYGTESKPAKVSYKDMTITAYKITFKQDENLLFAEALIDSGMVNEHPDSVKYIGLPEFNQTGEEPLYGITMVYNMATEKGRVITGRTKFGSAFFRGKDVVRVSEKALQIKDGYYTTCENEDHPHFYFRSPKMKFSLKDKVVARPVYLYIGGVPLIPIPFAVFPTKSGRRSGLIIPSYGASQREGRYLRGLGYYLAPNDYSDAKFLIDYYDKKGFLFRGSLKYRLRYILNGYLSGSITRMSSEETEERRWDLNVSHSHKFDPTMDMTVKGSFQSDKNYYKNYSLNRDVRSRRYMRSNARLNKRWEGTKNSISMNVQHDKDLENGSVKMTLPEVTFTRSSPTYPFRRSPKKQEQGRLEKKANVPVEREDKEDPWYSSFNFRYNSKLKSAVNETRSDEEDPFKKQQGIGVQHNLSFSFPQKIFSHINVNPGLTYNENWYDRYTEKFDTSGQVESREVRKFAARRTYNGTVSMNTKFFGLYAPNIAGITALRHVVTPNVTFSYRPDFSDHGFGNYKTYIDTAGVEQEYDRFEDVGSLTLGGRTPSMKSRSVSLRLDNLIQMKKMAGEKEDKFDLFNVSFATGYNFEAETYKWSNISTNFHLKKFATLDLNATHSLYRFDESAGTVVDELLFSSKDWWKGGFARLVSMNATTRFRLAGGGEEGEGEERKGSGEKEQPSEKEESLPGTDDSEENESRFDDKTELSDYSIPWDIDMSLRYSLTKYNPLNPNKIFTGTIGMNTQLTTNWKMSVRGGIDFKDKKFTYIDFSFYRDLHCWELQFDWTPSGSRSGFFLIVKIKDPQLQDLKIQKRSYGGGSALGTFYSGQ